MAGCNAIRMQPCVTQLSRIRCWTRRFQKYQVGESWSEINGYSISRHAITWGLISIRRFNRRYRRRSVLGHASQLVEDARQSDPL